MGVTDEFDRDVRRRLATEFTAAPSLIDLGVTGADGPPVWTVAEKSAAAGDGGIETLMWAFLAAELDGDGTVNLPLTQARALLTDAAGSLAALGRITTDPDPALRFAATGPLARSSTERAALAWWVFSGTDRPQRLRRALAVEIEGVDSLLRYLPAARTDRSDNDLQRMRTRLVALADTEAGGYSTDERGRVRIGGERRPSFTKLVTNTAGQDAYSELSAHTHPTGHLHVTNSDWSRGGHRQVAYEPRSTVHDEGRLCRPAVQTVAVALVTVSRYVGATGTDVEPWLDRMAALWCEWCSVNGC